MSINSNEEEYDPENYSISNSSKIQNNLKKWKNSNISPQLSKKQKIETSSIQYYNIQQRKLKIDSLKNKIEIKKNEIILLKNEIKEIEEQQLNEIEFNLKLLDFYINAY